jgi:hypothetical protein
VVGVVGSVGFIEVAPGKKNIFKTKKNYRRSKNKPTTHHPPQTHHTSISTFKYYIYNRIHIIIVYSSSKGSI